MSLVEDGDVMSFDYALASHISFDVNADDGEVIGRAYM